ncbi:beta-amyrin 28-monooxygenase-like isoform X2 [Papaver somniferum]|uniref:beta-amyrin 28-monooxygenase-like isoform X2 n=1 Tax=Papaver somniferum TaxID=3469 RepID=UPI000E6F9E11|nr:beta-amyrin 28-monooxygenase-like isoform X2 [Papaver somniferum]
MDVHLNINLLYILLGLSAVAYLVIHKFSNSSGNTRLPPGSLGWPIVGETLEFQRLGQCGKSDEFPVQRMNKYNREIFKTHLFGEKTITLCGATGNKFLFTGEKTYVLTWWPNSLKKLFGDSFFTTPYEEAVRTVACDMFASMDDPNWQKMILDEFNILLKGVFQFPIYFPGTRHYKAVKAAAVIRRELMKLIQSRRGLMVDLDRRVERNLISHLMGTKNEDGELLSDKEIADNVILLMNAGHDTSSSTMMMLMKYLAESPDCYNRVLKEQREIASRKSPGELLNKDDISKMKYSWGVIQEVLRMSPPVQGTFRKAKVDFTYSGFSIPKGWAVWWTTSTTHKSEEYFPNAETFDPLRFARDNITPYSFVPFGGGPRMCPGREFAKVEILVFLHNLVNMFKWELVFPDDVISVDPMPTSSKGLPVYLYSHPYL